MGAAVQDLALTLLARALGSGSDRRFVVAIAGPPGAGKSTLAQILARTINGKAGREIARLVPMDGFHRYDDDLRRAGLHAVKGAPETFRAEAFVRLVTRLKTHPAETTLAPEYNRRLHDPQEDAIRIAPSHRIVLVEGNYLLLDAAPWNGLRGVYDYTLLLTAPEELLRRRLEARHLRGGKTPAQARAKVEGTDLPNMRLVLQGSTPPDVCVDARSLLLDEPPDDANDNATGGEIHGETDAGGSSAGMILGLGASTVDVSMLVDQFPTRRETLRAADGALAGGGPVSTALAVIGALGGRAGIIDRIGGADDWKSEFIRAQYRAFGVSTRYLFSDAGAEPSLSAILVRRDTAERAIHYLPGSGSEVTPEDIDAVNLGGVVMVHANGRHPAACQRLFARARERGILTSFDGGAGRYSAEHHALAAQADICIVAKEFAERMTGTNEAETALARMARMTQAAQATQATQTARRGPGIVGVTDGSRGSWLFRQADGAMVHQPAILTQQTVDTTGCGDAYHGAFLFAYAQGAELAGCARLAARVASVNSTRLGGRGCLPSPAEAQAWLRGEVDASQEDSRQ